jgi:hypothetical protein
MKFFNILFSAAFLTLGLGTAAIAQTTPAVQTAPIAQTAPAGIYLDTACGEWQTDTWTPNTMCTGVPKKHARVDGTITIVKGHLVTVQQSTGTIIVDDTPALNKQDTGKVAVGRTIVAHGYWDGDNFYATLITTSGK